jgi:hypothetical protein
MGPERADVREDKEFREVRDLMPVPDKFSDGFKIGTILMGLFVGFVMAPASVYMNLVAGLQMGEAAKWVTVLLYVEIMRRAFKKLTWTTALQSTSLIWSIWWITCSLEVRSP